MAHALALTLGSIPLSLSTLLLGDRNEDAPLLLFLYVCVAAAFLAWLSLPLVDGLPDASSF